MKHLFSTLMALICLYGSSNCQDSLLIPCVTHLSVTKIFIVRHADKLAAGDGLSPAGVTRAKELKRVLGMTKIDSVFSTNFVRTRNTVKPLADFIGVPVKLYTTEDAVIARILQFSKGKRLLVAGHSNTVANLIQKCGCTPPASINPIPDTQFDNLFLVLVRRIITNGQLTSTCELFRMKYGAITN